MSVDLSADIIDVRDIIERIECLRETSNSSVVDGVNGAEYEGHEDDHQEYAELIELLSELAGYGGDEQFEGDWYPITLIRDSHFKRYAQELADDIGAVPSDYTWPTSCIDWDRAARELQMDYTSVEINGATYWYR